MTRDLRDELKQHEEDMIATVRDSGGSTQQYCQERKKAIEAVVSEIEFLPRITAAS